VFEEEGAGAKPYEVVGVVEDAAYRSLRADLPPVMFRPLAQGPTDGPQGTVELTIRARTGDPALLTKPVAEAINAIEPRFALTIRPFSAFVRAATRQERLIAIMAGFFGGLALLLAGLGLYGVTSYSVSLRRAEIGIRLALGARPDGIVAMVLRRATWLVTAGILIGAGISLWVVRFVTSLLYGVPPRDTLTLIAGAIALLGVGVIAAWIPARRAARVDPTITLRAN
jgi:putative ABC transport system permease protein